MERKVDSHPNGRKHQAAVELRAGDNQAMTRAAATNWQTGRETFFVYTYNDQLSFIYNDYINIF